MKKLLVVLSVVLMFGVSYAGEGDSYVSAVVKCDPPSNATNNSSNAASSAVSSATSTATSASSATTGDSTSSATMGSVTNLVNINNERDLIELPILPNIVAPIIPGRMIDVTGTIPMFGKSHFKPFRQETDVILKAYSDIGQPGNRIRVDEVYGKLFAIADKLMNQNKWNPDKMRFKVIMIDEAFGASFMLGGGGGSSAMTGGVGGAVAGNGGIGVSRASLNPRYMINFFEVE